MNHHTKIHLALALAASLFTVSSSFADGTKPNISDYTDHISTRAQAEKLEKGTKMAFACTSCKTVKPIGEKKTFLAWFAPDEKHDCPGCHGKVTFVSVPGGKPPTATEFSHVCTKCGDKSAYTCAGHNG